MSDDVSDAVQIVKIDYVGLSEKIARLETFRDEHKEQHAENVATHGWVYKQALILLAAAGAVGATLGGAIIRAIFG